MIHIQIFKKITYILISLSILYIILGLSKEFTYGEINYGERLTNKMNFYIIPMGDIDKGLLNTIKNSLKVKFNAECIVLGSIIVPESAYDKERQQFLCSSIIEELKSHIEDRDMYSTRVLGVVDVDIYAPQLNYIFGQADVGNGICVISLARLNEEFYGREADEELLKKRAIKEAMHEIGHTYGMGHCFDARCVMFFSNTLADTDYKEADFCPKHKKILKEYR